MDNFRSTDDIPPPYRNIFTEYPCFNAVQSQVLDDILYTDNSVVVSAPTGSGKTAIFELAVIRLLIQYENLDVSQKIKMVYISPIKALCHERLVDWHKKFGPFGLNCVAITGDSDNVDFQHLINHNLIISTPEKWDSLTRRWRDNEKIVKVVKLFMIDEVHLLNEENRGSTLEVLVCRMKTVEQCISTYATDNIFNQKVRFIAVSATVPNVEDIAAWIGKPPNTKFYKFSEDMRPVKLRKIVYGYSYNPKTASPFKFDISLNYKLQSLLMQYSEGKPTLIFCSTRKSVEMTANHIVQSLRIHLNQEQTQKLLDVANLTSDSKAKATIKHGVGYHHAGMIPETRHAIENLFRNGDLPVLVTTSTLAMGVNLPAHLVIIKSTKCYDSGGFRDYTETAIHQMIGRAGRPQFDTSATALILTTNEDKVKFERMVGCLQPIESNLHRHLTEHLNAEVVLRTITDLDVAMQWLSSTFLYVRARKNPRHYGISVGLTQAQIDKKLLEICQIDLNKLVKSGMITMDQNVDITATNTGRIMAKYYIAFETMKLFTQISGTEILIQILALISKCEEFAPMRLRVNDKKTLNLLNKNSKKNTIRFPLNGKIKTWDMKVNCIIQAVLGNLDILDHSILSESLTIIRNGQRIAKCLIEYLETRGKGCYSALLNSIILAKCLQAKLWENSPYVSKQLTGIGNVMSNQLVNAGKTSFKKIIESNPRDIEIIIKRKPPMGNALIEEVERIPSYSMTLVKLDEGKQLEITITLDNSEVLREKSTVPTKSIMNLLVGNSLNEILVYEKYEHSYMIENVQVKKIVNLDPSTSEVHAHFISENWVGIDCNATLEIEVRNESKTNKKLKAKSPDKAGPTYIQMFLDMYMKSKKNTTTDAPSKKEASVAKKTVVVKKNTAKLQNSGSICDGTIKTGTSPKEREVKTVTSHDGVAMAPAPINSKIKELEGVEAKQQLNLSNASTFSDGLSSCVLDKYLDQVDVNLEREMSRIMDDLENEAVQKSVGVVEDTSTVTDFDDVVAKAPSLFSMSQKYGTSWKKGGSCARPVTVSKGKRKGDEVRDAMEFEDSLYKEDLKKRQKLGEFKFPNKKKFSHETKYSPDSTQSKYRVTEILEATPTCNNYVGEKNKENVQRNITWRSPLVSSPAVKFSPKIQWNRNEKDTTSNNETFESISFNSNLAVNAQTTPIRTQNRDDSTFKHSSRQRGTTFLLSDKDYVETSHNENQFNDSVFDICSPSFLGKAALPNKSTPKSKPAQTSLATVNYYSRLLSQPVDSQKEKGKETEHNTEDANCSRVIPETVRLQRPRSESDTERNVSEIGSSFSEQKDYACLDTRRNLYKEFSAKPPVQHPTDYFRDQLSQERYDIPQADLNRSYHSQVTPARGYGAGTNFFPPFVNDCSSVYPRKKRLPFEPVPTPNYREIPHGYYGSQSVHDRELALPWTSYQAELSQQNNPYYETLPFRNSQVRRTVPDLQQNFLSPHMGTPSRFDTHEQVPFIPMSMPTPVRQFDRPMHSQCFGNCSKKIYFPPLPDQDNWTSYDNFPPGPIPKYSHSKDSFPSRVRNNSKTFIEGICDQSTIKDVEHATPGTTPIVQFPRPPSEATNKSSDFNLSEDQESVSSIPNGFYRKFYKPSTGLGSLQYPRAVVPSYQSQFMVPYEHYPVWYGAEENMHASDAKQFLMRKYFCSLSGDERGGN